MTILVDIIPTAYRRYLYAAVAFVGLVLGACQVAGLDVTAWLGVYAFVTTATGLTAYANTRPTDATAPIYSETKD